MTDGPLSDLLVLDLPRALAGPHAAMMLGDMGARVIKVESPTGDDTRGWGPPFIGDEDERESTYFLSANRNKESLVLDLKSAEDKEVLARLVERALAMALDIESSEPEDVVVDLEQVEEVGEAVAGDVVGIDPRAGRRTHDVDAHDRGSPERGRAFVPELFDEVGVEAILTVLVTVFAWATATRAVDDAAARAAVGADSRLCERRRIEPLLDRLLARTPAVELGVADEIGNRGVRSG